MEPPTRLRMEPKLGTVSAINNKTNVEKVLNATLFQLKSKKDMILMRTKCLRIMTHLMGY